ncbi:MAG: RnfABCDGE type electron transport complex subunit G [Firmicutes bacterium]|nr:RnfABCDGE type electron transport complex subunit G [Bacillota bacterium]
MKSRVSIPRLALTLLLITALAAGALSAVNAITQERIAAIEQEKILEAISQVLPDGEDAQEVALSGNTGLVQAVYASASGYAVQVAPSGFKDTITLMVGVSPEGAVLAISVVSHSETAGLGAVCAADTTAGQRFRDSFVGLTGSVAVSKDGGEADTLTGATITSRAVAEGVSAALAWVAENG